MIDIKLRSQNGELYSSIEQDEITQIDVWCMVSKLEQIKLDLLDLEFDKPFSYSEGSENEN